MTHSSAHLFTLLVATAPALAMPQNGDRPGEQQPPLPDELAIPPAPVLTVEQAAAAFVLPPELEIRCVASEPLVVDPVDVVFDGDSRLWVVEMRGYMPNIDGTGEDVSNGRIAVLRDEDGDGVMDERTDFLDGLVMPRAVLPYRDGALVIVPPELRFYRDTDGDGVADTHEVIAKGLGGLHSPEHAINAPRWTDDNWIQLSNHRVRYRESAEGWQRQATNGGGQWGLSFDETGRAFFNTNSDGLRGDTYPSHYAVRNPNSGTASGVNVRIAHDQAVWPARITPGVNRGYRPETLRDDFTLRNFTGACGPLVYLGDALPAEFRGDAFVAEPCGNLVKRFELGAGGPFGLDAVNAYEGREFLASTDERFRPVNLVDGPDGALYVVDMYRGVIQHRLFVTSWLRAQVEARGLEQPLGLGRIWRIAPRAAKRNALESMSEASWTDLMALLGDPNGWRRLTAQRLIVEEGFEDGDVIELCRTAIAERPSALARMHALWALQGIGALDDASVIACLQDQDRRVALAGLRCAEEALTIGSAQVLGRVGALARSDDARLRRQALLSLGEAHTAGADALLVELAIEDVSEAARRSALLSSLHDRELAFLEALLAREEWALARDGRFELLESLSRCITKGGRSDRINLLLSLVASAFETSAWHGSAMTDGMLAGRPRGPQGELAAIRMPAQPEALAALAGLDRRPGGKQIKQLVDVITWPGGPNAGDTDVRPMTPAERALFERGRSYFAEVCSACHQASGLGEDGKAPPLRNSPWALGSKKRAIRIVVGGLTGPIVVGGKTWNLEMPVYNPSPEHVAAVLTYVRREWGHGAEPVSTEDVLEVLKEMESRTAPWTAAELEAAPD